MNRDTFAMAVHYNERLVALNKKLKFWELLAERMNHEGDMIFVGYDFEITMKLRTPPGETHKIDSLTEKLELIPAALRIVAKPKEEIAAIHAEIEAL